MICASFLFDHCCGQDKQQQDEVVQKMAKSYVGKQHFLTPAMQKEKNQGKIRQ